MSAPSDRPSKNGLIKLLFPPWRFGSKVKIASDQVLDAGAESCIKLEIIFAGLVVAGVIGEVIIALRHPAYDSLWEIGGSVAGNAAVAIGVAAETLFLGLGHFIQGELSQRSKKELAESINARAELEKKLWPRMLNQEQWDFIQELRGKISIVAIAFETDAEPRWFAGQIQSAFFSAGISVAAYPRDASVHSFGILIFEPQGFDGSRPRTAQPLVEIFNKGEMIGSLAIITAVPTDILRSIEETRPEMRAPLDTPMIIIGGRFVIPPPHLEVAAKAAKAARDKMTGNA